MSIASYKGEKFTGESFIPVKDVLTAEHPLQILVNGKPYTVTLQTPGGETELVRGLLFSENVYRDSETEPSLAVMKKSEKGFISVINVSVPENKTLKGIETTRNIMAASSCGICGTTELPETDSQRKALGSGVKVNPEAIGNMFSLLNKNQHDFLSSGGSHACAAFTGEGELLFLKEDIGRHNAVDKVIGSLIIHHKLTQAKCLLVSGRISYEIVNKCFSAGIPVLAAISAPSSLAVDLAESCGITLLGFCREQKFTVYSHPFRVKGT